MTLPAWGAGQPGRAALSPASPGRDVQEGLLEGTRARALKAVRALTDEARPPGLLPCPPPRGPHAPQPQPLRLLVPRTYEREALRKKFTRARDAESSDEDGYDWGPATDL